MHAQAPACRIILNKISEVGRKRSDLTKSAEQVLLFSPSELAKKIENFNGNEQTVLAHLGSSDSPSSRSHCSDGSFVVFSLNFHSLPDYLFFIETIRSILIIAQNT